MSTVQLPPNLALEKVVYLFRNVSTGQVVPSRSRVLKLDVVWKHLKKPPPKLRKDHWKPIVLIEGFEQDKTCDIVWHSLMTYPNPIRNAEWIKKPSRLREVQEMEEQAEHKISALCRILEELPTYTDNKKVFPESINKDDLKLNVLFETEYFKKIVGSQSLTWPKYLKFGKLDLIRGRNIANKEYNTTHSGREKLIQLHEMHKERIIKKSEKVE